MSTENGYARRMARAIRMLQQGRQTIPDLCEATGAHRHTITKLLTALQAEGMARPRGSVRRGNHHLLTWEMTAPRADRFSEPSTMHLAHPMEKPRWQ